MADAPAATPAPAENLSAAPAEISPPVTPTPRPKVEKPKTYEKNEARVTDLAKNAKEAAVAKLKARNGANGGDDDIDVDNYVTDPGPSPTQPKPVDPQKAPGTNPDDKGNSSEPGKDEKPKNLQESTNQALMRRENEVRRREADLKSKEQAAERGSKLSDAVAKRDYATVFQELGLNPKETAQFILENAETLGKMPAPSEPEDPRDKRIKELESQQAEISEWKNAQARQTAITQVQGLLKDAPDFELINHFGAHEAALAGLYEYHEKHGTLPVEGDEAESLKFVAKDLEQKIFANELGPKLEGLLKTGPGQRRLAELGYVLRPPQAGSQGPRARAGKAEVTLTNSIAREVPPRSDQQDHSPASRKAKALETLRRMRGQEVG